VAWKCSHENQRFKLHRFVWAHFQHFAGQNIRFLPSSKIHFSRVRSSSFASFSRLTIRSIPSRGIHCAGVRTCVWEHFLHLVIWKCYFYQFVKGMIQGFLVVNFQHFDGLKIDIYGVLKLTPQGYLVSWGLIMSSLAAWKCDSCQIATPMPQRYLALCRLIFYTYAAWKSDSWLDARPRRKGNWHCVEMPFVPGHQSDDSSDPASCLLVLSTLAPWKFDSCRIASSLSGFVWAHFLQFGVVKIVFVAGRQTAASMILSLSSFFCTLAAWKYLSCRVTWSTPQVYMASCELILCTLSTWKNWFVSGYQTHALRVMWAYFVHFGNSPIWSPEPRHTVTCTLAFWNCDSFRFARLMPKRYLASCELILCTLAPWKFGSCRVAIRTSRLYMGSCELIFCTLATWRLFSFRVRRLTPQRYVPTFELYFWTLAAWKYHSYRVAHFVYVGVLKNRFVSGYRTHAPRVPTLMWAYIVQIGSLKMRFVPGRQTHAPRVPYLVWAHFLHFGGLKLPIVAGRQNHDQHVHAFGELILSCLAAWNYDSFRLALHT